MRRQRLGRTHLRELLLAMRTHMPHATISTGTSHPPTDRRERARLRDLCDEVLASFRVAREREPISASERSDAREWLARLAPTARV